MSREARRPSESPTAIRGRVRILIQVLTKVWPPPKASEQFRTKILPPPRPASWTTPVPSWGIATPWMEARMPEAKSWERDRRDLRYSLFCLSCAVVPARGFGQASLPFQPSDPQSLKWRHWARWSLRSPPATGGLGVFSSWVMKGESE